MTMEMSQDKLKETKMELNTWLYKNSANRREVESLIGKLQFLAKCVKAGRIFLSRLIQLIKGMERGKKLPHTPQSKEGHCLVGQVHTRIQWGINHIDVQRPGD